MTLETGDVIQGRYRVASLLAQGGMAAIYRAWDTRLNVPVALKEMVTQPGLDADTLKQLADQFRREAQVLARLDHPHLVKVTDFFVDRDSSYLVMNFVEGESLAHRIGQQGTLPEEQVLTWAQQLLDALAYCHSQGIIHRDVKPQNVIIRPDGRVVLVDFGLVKLWDSSDPRTKTQMRGMGTPEYAPPEQYDIQVGHTDARSDLYSLGATLYHALSGEAPPTATLRMADPEEFKKLDALAPEVSKRVTEGIMKALALARSQRWQGAEHMAKAMGLSIPRWERHEGHTSAVAKAYSHTRQMKASETFAPSSRIGAASDRRQVERPESTEGRVLARTLALGGLALLVLVAGVVLAAGHSPLPPRRTPTLTENESGIVSPEVEETNPVRSSPTLTLRPKATAATATPRPSRTRTAQATSTPRSATETPTETPTLPVTETPTASPTTSSVPRPTRTPAPRATIPQLLRPAQGQEYQNPIVLEWRGSLGADQAYQVTAYHVQSGHTIQSDLLTGRRWTADLPAEWVGEWHWSVSVIKDGRSVTTSSEWAFWFNPFPNGGGGGGGEEDKITPVPPTSTSPPA